MSAPNLLIFASGAIVDSVNLAPVLYKRLHIEGSTLRSRSLEYQAYLIERYLRGVPFIDFTLYLVLPGLSWTSSQRSQEEMVVDPFGRIFIRRVTSNVAKTRFNPLWLTADFSFPTQGIPLDGNTIRASRNGREQK